MIYLDASALVKLAVEERESQALVSALRGRGPYLTSVVGAVETMRVCRRAGVAAEKVEEVLDGVALVALDDEVRRLAAIVGPATLRTLDAIHLATALSVGDDLDRVLTYDLRLAEAARDAGLDVGAPA